MNSTYFTLNHEQMTYVGLDPNITWHGVLGQSPTGVRCTFVTSNEVAFESIVNAAESGGVAPPEEFGRWLQSVTFEVEGWPEDWPHITT